MGKLLSIKEIAKQGRDGDYIAVGNNGRRYSAKYSAEHECMFFCIPSYVKIVGYVTAEVAENAAEAAELLREING